MAGRKSAKLSPKSIARANRQRLAAEEGARAMADIERQATAVRKNMERLRALRRARDEEAPGMDTVLLPEVKTRRKKGLPK